MFYANIDGSLPDFSGDYIVGAAADGSHGCLCDLDEVRLSTIVRPMAWARTAFAGQGPDGMLYSLGEEQAGGGGGLPVFYLATIMKNITLDGWVIIGLLIVLMMVSWIVFLNKTFFSGHRRQGEQIVQWPCSAGWTIPSHLLTRTTVLIIPVSTACMPEAAEPCGRSTQAAAPQIPKVS